jgi:class 3 adenylate cyclase
VAAAAARVAAAAAREQVCRARDRSEGRRGDEPTVLGMVPPQVLIRPDHGLLRLVTPLPALGRGRELHEADGEEKPLEVSDLPLAALVRDHDVPPGDRCADADRPSTAWLAGRVSHMCDPGTTERRQVAVTSAAPSAPKTFLFTDVQGSTALWERHPTEMHTALAEHDRIVRAAVAAAGGQVFSTAGDSFAVAFESAAAALGVALEVQRALRAPVGGLMLRIRVGVHTGQAEPRDGDYFGADVNRCARLMSAASGGQILVSSATATHLAGRLPRRRRARRPG